MPVQQVYILSASRIRTKKKKNDYTASSPNSEKSSNSKVNYHEYCIHMKKIN
jgi:hypothetical protein